MVEIFHNFVLARYVGLTRPCDYYLYYSVYRPVTYRDPIGSLYVTGLYTE